MLKGRESEARDVLRKTLSRRGQEAIEEEIEDIKLLKSSFNQNKFKAELQLLLRWKTFKR